MKAVTLFALSAVAAVAASNTSAAQFNEYINEVDPSFDLSEITQEDIDNHGLESTNYFYERQLEQGELMGITRGIDFSSAFSARDFTCFKNAGYTFAIPRGYQSFGRVDPSLASNVRNARANGMRNVDAYMFPCPKCGNAAGQVNSLVSSIKNNGLNVGMIWLDVEGTQYWLGNAAKNRAFFNSLLAAAAKSGKKIGIYSSKYMWTSLFGNGYTSGGNYPLWYAHYDGKANFSDFSAFGGFKKPAIKQYVGDTTVCGRGVDLNFY